MNAKEIPLEERIEKIFESGWVNEFNYLENLMQETRICLCELQKELQRKDNIISELKKDLEYYKHEEELYRYYQQENEKLKDILNKIMISDEETTTPILDLIKEKEDYKSRIEKAIEYIKEHNVIAVNKGYLPNDFEYCCDIGLLNILRGEDIENIFKGDDHEG